jgi:hypothetical protein
MELSVIDISENTENEATMMLLSEIAEDITFIPLETTVECLIGRIRSVHFSIVYYYSFPRNNDSQKFAHIQTISFDGCTTKFHFI